MSSVWYRFQIASLVAAAVGFAGFVPTARLNAAQSESRQSAGVQSANVTFTKDIAPILQSKCQNCHRPDSVAPMSLVTYEEARPWARSMKTKTGLRNKRGAMPPWGVEKEIGIQKYKGDRSLSEEEIAKFAAWADSGAPKGNPADMPPPLKFTDGWTIGEPDLVVKGPYVTVPASGADGWGPIGEAPTGLTEDRYVSAVEVRETHDISASESGKPGGQRPVIHHAVYSSRVPDATGAEPPTSWPSHEIGRNADIFSPDAGKLLRANSILAMTSVHTHPNGRETKARMEFGFKFFPKGYKPLYKEARFTLANTMDMDLKPNTPDQELHAYMVLQENVKIVTFEPHLHGSGTRMCLEAIWGGTIEQLTCASYDHNWVMAYAYEEGAEPLLPKGTIVHLIGWVDMTSANKNVNEPRNWVGSGRRAVSSMFMNLGSALALTDEQFLAEVAKRRQTLKSKNEWSIGCPLCQAPALDTLQLSNQTAGN